jgi:aerotaxis receptor
VTRRLGQESTGHVRTYAPSEIFFSTTDRKGVIETVNSTFVNLAHFSENELVGSPHNLIRHHDMPAGVFHIMWERLLAGQRVAAYVTNLAGDGATYHTFTTVTPLGEGFLAVRTAVSRNDHWQLVVDAYAQTRSKELKWLRQGIPRKEVAALGARDLLQRFAALGYPTYDDVMRVVVPEEVAARHALAPPARPASQPSESLHELVGAIDDVSAQVTELMAFWAGAGELARTLKGAKATMQQTLRQLEFGAQAAAEASAPVSYEAPILTTTAIAVMKVARHANQELVPLTADLDTARDAVLDLLVAMSVAHLQSDMALVFAREYQLGQTIGDPIVSARHLAQALGEATDGVQQVSAQVSWQLRQVTEHIDEAQSHLLEFQRLLSDWRNLAVKLGVADQISDLLEPVDARLDVGMGEMRELARLGATCRQYSTPVDIGVLRDAADAVVRSAQGLIASTS